MGAPGDLAKADAVQGTTALDAAYVLACQVVPAAAIFAETEVHLEDMRRKAALRLVPFVAALTECAVELEFAIAGTDGGRFVEARAAALAALRKADVCEPLSLRTLPLPADGASPPSPGDGPAPGITS